LGAEVHLGRLGGVLEPGLVKRGVAEGRHRHVLTLEEEPEGRRAAAKIGLDDLQTTTLGRGRRGRVGRGSGSRRGDREGRRPADGTESQHGTGGRADVGRAPEIVGDDLVEIGWPARASTLAQVVDDEDGQVRLSSNSGEEAEEGTGAVEAGLASGGGAGQRVDHNKGRPDLLDHLDEMELLHRIGKVYGAGRAGSEHEKEAAPVDVPGLGTLVEEGRRVLGIDDEYVASRARYGRTVGKGVVLDDAASKV